MTSSRTAGVAGLLYVLLLVVGIAVLGTPEGDAPDAEWMDHFSDSANRTRTLLAGMSVTGAGLAFLVASPGLVRRAGPVASAAAVTSLPTGVRRAGYVVAVLSLGGIALIPTLLWLVWVAVLSVLALRRPAPTPQ